MSARTLLRLSILLAAIAIAVDLAALVLLIPILISPTAAGGGRNVLLIAVICVGLVVGVAAMTLRRQAKAAAHQGDGA